MEDDRNLFGGKPVNHAYTNFKSKLDEAVMTGKMTHLDAIQHIERLRNFARENKHDHAAAYIQQHSKKLGWEAKEAWHKEEVWSK